MKLRLALSVAALALSGCRPYDKPEFKEIAPNETAFMIALEGDAKTNQSKFQSEEYLNSVKVATKRVQIPHRTISTGRSYLAVDYIPTVKLICVDRTPQTRSWTKDKSSGTSSKDEAVHVESQDSVGFSIGVTCTAAVEENDAAKFLYHYAGRTLDQIMDSDVRNWVQSYASGRFGALPLSECQKSKGQIFADCAKEAREFFKQYGVTVRNLGYSEGMSYENPEIQKQIDNAFTAELQKKVAEQDRQAQLVRNQKDLESKQNDLKIQQVENQKDLSVAENKRKVAEEFAKQQQAQTQMVELEVKKIQAQAMLTFAQKWSGGVPGMLIMGDKGQAAQMPLLMPITAPTQAAQK